MKKWLLFAAITALLVLFFRALPTPPVSVGQNFVLGPVRIFDGERYLPGMHYLTVKAGLIAAIDDAPPTSELPRVDGGQQLLLPGLIDAHVHSWDNARAQQLSFGVTSAIDMFSPAAELTSRRQQRAGTAQTLQADSWNAGILATAPRGHGTEYGLNIPTISSAAEAAAFVAARKAEGSDFIKIVYQSERAIYRRMPSISLATLQALIAAAHQQQLKAVVHIAEQVSAEEAADAGADGLVHSFFDSPISERLLATLASRQVFVIPTLTVLEAAVRGTSGPALLAKPDLSLPATAKAALAGAKQPQIPAALFRNLLDNTRRMQQAGIRILAGTDAPNSGTSHGLSMVQELMLLQEAGLTAEQALQSATALPAQAFGLSDRGRIAVGYRADFVLLPQLDDPIDLLKARQVFKNGFAVPLSLTEDSRAAVKAGLLTARSDGHSNNPQQKLPASQGDSFSVSTDQLFGGQSTARLEVAEGVFSVSGRISPESDYPWAGFSWQAAADFSKGLDFSASDRLQFELKSTAGSQQSGVRLMIFSEGSNRPVTVSLPVSAQWQSHDIRLGELTGVQPERITLLLWSAAQPAAGAESFGFAVRQLAFLSGGR